MRIGYARVSTLEQETALQLDALKRASVEKVYQEKRSAVSRRPMLEAMLDQLRAGDTVVVYKLDRLARSLRDLLHILDHIEHAGAFIASTSEPIDTSTPAGRMMVQMLGALGEFERSLIVERTKAGLQAARERGVKFGRSRAMTPTEEAACVRAFLAGGVTKSALARRYGCHISSVKRALARADRDQEKGPHAAGLVA
jgi:DNA invertase Pin-like site-specific DNA recombinase